MNELELVRLGTLLHRHSWQDSHDWARALDELAHLSESEMGIIAEVVCGCGDAAGKRPAPARSARPRDNR